MWCLCLDVVVPKHATPFYKSLVPSVSATSEPRRRRQEHKVGELGHTLVATPQSNPTPISKPQQQQQQQQGKKEGEQISGLDVLWALHRASDTKKMKKNKQEKARGRDSSSVVSPMEESDVPVDHSNVRPLRINAHWGPKLDDLEKRLRDLSDTI